MEEIEKYIYNVFGHRYPAYIYKEKYESEEEKRLSSSFFILYTFRFLHSVYNLTKENRERANWLLLKFFEKICNDQKVHEKIKIKFLDLGELAVKYYIDNNNYMGLIQISENKNMPEQIRRKAKRNINLAAMKYVMLRFINKEDDQLELMAKDESVSFKIRALAFTLMSALRLKWKIEEFLF